MMTADRPTNGVTAYDMRHELTIVWPGGGHRAYRNRSVTGAKNALRWRSGARKIRRADAANNC